MLKTCLAAALSLAATIACAHDEDRRAGFMASGDGAAHLSLLGSDVKGPRRLAITATFLVDLPVMDSTEAHAKSRWFSGEILVDGKPCADTRARVRADAGRAHAEASASCEIGVTSQNRIKIEAVAGKADGLDRDDVHVELVVDDR
jgi:hypothetical protein